MQCLALTALCTILWLVCGYSLAFAEGSPFLGGLSKVFARGIGAGTLAGTIPEMAFFVFQMTFAIITPALIVGAFAERMKFSAMLWFSGVWLVLVYAPICHMTWGGEGTFFGDLGVFDFAGGIVVHITAGVAALVACLVIGPRKGYPTTAMPPHNMTMCATGTGMLWVGWYGFNGGSALGANGDAAMAIAVTQISAATAAFTWMTIEWLQIGKPSVLGVATGAIAGLAAVTPASGYIGPIGGLSIGLVSGFVCWWAATVVKIRLGYDDSLDVFGVHGVGGFVGTVLAGVFAAGVFGGKEADLAIGRQIGVQLLASGVTIVYTGVASFAILKAIDATIGLRVTQEDEVVGLDTTLHAEVGYDL
jgi:Amt family ammonium transporter